jgi:hypothetical protein
MKVSLQTVRVYAIEIVSPGILVVALVLLQVVAILPRVLSSYEEAIVRCAKARPGSNSSAGSKAPPERVPNNKNRRAS